jgi:hypothetical protein
MERDVAVVNVLNETVDGMAAGVSGSVSSGCDTKGMRETISACIACIATCN